MAWLWLMRGSTRGRAAFSRYQGALSANKCEGIARGLAAHAAETRHRAADLNHKIFFLPFGRVTGSLCKSLRASGMSPPPLFPRSRGQRATIRPRQRKNRKGWCTVCAPGGQKAVQSWPAERGSCEDTYMARQLDVVAREGRCYLLSPPLPSPQHNTFALCLPRAAPKLVISARAGIAVPPPLGRARGGARRGGVTLVSTRCGG